MYIYIYYLVFIYIYHMYTSIISKYSVQNVDNLPGQGSTVFIQREVFIHVDLIEGLFEEVLT